MRVTTLQNNNKAFIGDNVDVSGAKIEFRGGVMFYFWKVILILVVAKLNLKAVIL